ncbi:hypothetical protein Y032_0049g1798 [Ancylostoma ceylanicum]|uniref:Beta-lactamase-related domain-containing protein n=1 Tax=Ancylostoma ceylanicum TaxID=53326 RepID=A0A016UA53_9BILA|nr:hypothetical protein Y032_0049g1798 [Ancylostoma ceylanicum]
MYKTSKVVTSEPGFMNAKPSETRLANQISRPASLKELLERFKTPQISSGLDEIVMTPLPKGHGFLYERHPTPGKQWLVGHPGFGGSTVMMDMEDEVTFPLLPSLLRTSIYRAMITSFHLPILFRYFNDSDIFYRWSSPTSPMV